jgi:Domain of unknown function (DUF4286)
MIFYNITSRIDPSAATAWPRWAREEYVPRVLGTGFFDDHKIYRLLGDAGDEGPTYIVQFRTGTEQRCLAYIEGPASEINRYAKTCWGDRCLSFYTRMELVQ